MGTGASKSGTAPPESPRISARNAELVKQIAGRKFDASRLDIMPLLASGSPEADKLFDEMDTDASGALSLRELTAALIAHGAGLGADWVPEAIQRALEKYDTDGDGELDRAEFAAALADLSGGDAREEISFPGNIVAGEFGHHGTMCTGSFPGEYKEAWDKLVAKAEQGGLSTACVFLTTAEQGKHSADPEAGRNFFRRSSCFCHKLYGGPMKCGPGLVKLIGGSSKARLSLPDSPPPSTAPYIIVYDCTSTPTWLY